MTDTNPIRGILFDKDGTLFDFGASWGGVVDQVLLALSPDAALRRTMALAVGYDPDAQSFQPGSPCVAGGTDEIAEILASHLPDRTVPEVEALTNRIAEDALTAGGFSPAVPDLPGFLAGLKSAGLILGIATHDSEAAAIAHMEEFGARAHFDFIAGYDSGHGLKPGPGMLLAFAAATGLPPAAIAMVGDSVHDLGVAPAAGAAMAVGVLTGPAEREDLEPLADHVIPSIADLPALLGISL
ncbi:MAG: HAD-IA family hydrolase [Pseudomonadota bacterium]